MSRRRWLRLAGADESAFDAAYERMLQRHHPAVAAILAHYAVTGGRR